MLVRILLHTTSAQHLSGHVVINETAVRFVVIIDIMSNLFFAINKTLRSTLMESFVT